MTELFQNSFILNVTLGIDRNLKRYGKWNFYYGADCFFRYSDYNKTGWSKMGFGRIGYKAEFPFFKIYSLY
ncbi:hypothetical protein SD427_15030 [Chryseobacterium sp. JJR-5R]|uniref:hypothetical protein n=1 Tax=Chryseobacterium sp. JJR-5R TaxID=3093923 RepID=UPI002A765F2B|nr:hypothetical protein [Chryseobacterium sp. JJR-5R]WPO82069.1 hypothetical protein SD427_15030 [Chryseobacterium sp. JJR-5R]